MGVASRTVADTSLKRGESEIWRHVKPTPLFPERVFEVPRFLNRVPPEPVEERRESTRKADSNNPMAGWRRSAGRRPMRKRKGRRRFHQLKESDGVGKHRFAARFTSVNRTSRARTPRWALLRTRPPRRLRSGGVHWSTRGEGRTLKRNKAQGSIGPTVLETVRTATDLEME